MISVAFIHKYKTQQNYAQQVRPLILDVELRPAGRSNAPAPNTAPYTRIRVLLGASQQNCSSKQYRRSIKRKKKKKSRQRKRSALLKKHQ
jgi:hypothetical protein